MIQFTTTTELLKTLEVNKLNPTDYRPAYNGESVGLDLYLASPEDITIPPSRGIALDTEQWLWDEWYGAIKLPTGLKVVLPPNHGGFIWQRGSITKFPETLSQGSGTPGALIHQAGCVDPGYTDEIFIPVLNLSNEPIVIHRFTKLPWQLVVTPCITQFCYIDSDNYNTSTRHALRKEAAFGSSN